MIRIEITDEELFKFIEAVENCRVDYELEYDGGE